MDATQAEAPTAAEGVRAEVEKISTDRTHPMYSGYHAGHKPVMDYVQRLYEKAVGTAPRPQAASGDSITIGEEGITIGGAETPPPVMRGEPAAPSDSRQDPLIDETMLTEEQGTGVATARAEFGPQFPTIVNSALRGVAYVSQEPTANEMQTSWDPFLEKLSRYKDAFTFEAYALADKYMTRAINQGE